MTPVRTRSMQVRLLVAALLGFAVSDAELPCVAEIHAAYDRWAECSWIEACSKAGTRCYLPQAGFAGLCCMITCYAGACVESIRHAIKLARSCDGVPRSEPAEPDGVPVFSTGSETMPEWTQRMCSEKCGASTVPSDVAGSG